MAISKTEPFSSRLLVRPPPLKGESLRGFLLRVGERNGYGKGTNLFSALTGNQSGQYMVSDQALDNVAQALSLGRQQIETISYRPVAKGVTSQRQFFGHTVSVNHLRSSQPAVCPDCLAQQQAISGLWDLRAVCVCPHHGKWLIDRCPACDESLKWNRTSVISCQGGFDLRKLETKPAPSEVLTLTALVYEMVFNDLPTFAEQSLGYPEEVRQIPLNELFGLFRYVADVLMPAHPITQEERAGGSEAFSKQSHAAMLMARLLKTWPDGMALVLGDIFSSEGKDIPTVLSATEFKARYGRVMLAALAPGSRCFSVPSFFKRALQQFRDEYCISSTGEGRYLNPSLVSRAADGQRTMKWGVCLEVLGIPSGEDSLEETMPFQTYLQKKAKRRDRTITPQQAKLWLGCSSAHFDGLIDLRLLRPLAGGDFLKNEVIDLVKSLDCVAVDIEQTGSRPFDLLQLTGFKRPTKSNKFARLVQAITKKEVGVYKLGGAATRSLSDLYVSISEMKNTGHWGRSGWSTREPG